MTGLLRVYLPNECDAAGVPLDWSCCRNCEGTGAAHGVLGSESEPCEVCHAHGSLHAATLAKITALRGDVLWLHGGPMRCEDCQHPQSEGTWEDPPLASGARGSALGYVETRRRGDRAVREGREPIATAGHSQHYSPCDDLCNHGGPVRLLRDHAPPIYLPDQGPITPDWMVVHAPVEASWRPVDVRRLSWPMDLRPETLACLCLRCWANRPETMT